MPCKAILELGDAAEKHPGSLNVKPSSVAHARSLTVGSTIKLMKFKIGKIIMNEQYVAAFKDYKTLFEARGK